jgi:hypothetical protein
MFENVLQSSNHPATPLFKDVDGDHGIFRRNWIAKALLSTIEYKIEDCIRPLALHIVTSDANNMTCKWNSSHNASYRNNGGSGKNMRTQIYCAKCKKAAGRGGKYGKIYLMHLIRESYGFPAMGTAQRKQVKPTAATRTLPKFTPPTAIISNAEAPTTCNPAQHVNDIEQPHTECKVDGPVIDQVNNNRPANALVLQAFIPIALRETLPTEQISLLPLLPSPPPTGMPPPMTAPPPIVGPSLTAAPRPMTVHPLTAAPNTILTTDEHWVPQNRTAFNRARRQQQKENKRKNLANHPSRPRFSHTPPCLPALKTTNTNTEMPAHNNRSVSYGHLKKAIAQQKSDASGTIPNAAPQTRGSQILGPVNSFNDFNFNGLQRSRPDRAGAGDKAIDRVFAKRDPFWPARPATTSDIDRRRKVCRVYLTGIRLARISDIRTALSDLNIASDWYLNIRLVSAASSAGIHFAELLVNTDFTDLIKHALDKAKLKYVAFEPALELEPFAPAESADDAIAATTKFLDGIVAELKGTNEYGKAKVVHYFREWATMVAQVTPGLEETFSQLYAEIDSEFEAALRRIATKKSRPDDQRRPARQRNEYALSPGRKYARRSTDDRSASPLRKTSNDRRHRDRSMTPPRYSDWEPEELSLEEHRERALQTKHKTATKPIGDHGNTPKWAAVESSLEKGGFEALRAPQGQSKHTNPQDPDENMTEEQLAWMDQQMIEMDAYDLPATTKPQPALSTEPQSQRHFVTLEEYQTVRAIRMAPTTLEPSNKTQGTLTPAGSPMGTEPNAGAAPEQTDVMTSTTDTDCEQDNVAEQQLMEMQQEIGKELPKDAAAHHESENEISDTERQELSDTESDSSIKPKPKATGHGPEIAE